MERWAGPDRLRPLSEPGRRGAHGLLAQRRGLPIEPAQILGVDADPGVLVALLLDPTVGEAVLCSHGELIGTALEYLVGHDLDDEVELAWPKGSTWVLDVDNGHLRQRHYLPPLRPHDPGAGYQ